MNWSVFLLNSPVGSGARCVATKHLGIRKNFNECLRQGLRVMRGVPDLADEGFNESLPLFGIYVTRPGGKNANSELGVVLGECKGHGCFPRNGFMIIWSRPNFLARASQATPLRAVSWRR
ncbi:hypothetical protein CKA38_11980 [Ereboglobus luteus]|uniref:Uncharacterized protein n=1 Tax=Ereboglobus luteus TaxID=1796921 RepID=A0A2U8E4U2_9BACT|nr:hypothetical protein CKA38_11980 [Ereboglobus luteus]